MFETADVAMAVGFTVFWIASIAYRPAWKFFLTHLVTFVHELGHAFTGFLVGRGVGGIKLHFDGSGETRDFGFRGWLPFGLSRTISLLMGYPAPVLLGAFLLGAGVGNYINLAMWIMLFFGLFCLIFVRNLWGLLVVLGWIGFSLLAATYLYDNVLAEIVVVAVGTFFVVGGIKDLFMLFNQLTTGQAADTDLGIMQRERWGFPKTLTYLGMVLLALPGGWFMFLLSSTLLERIPMLTALS